MVNPASSPVRPFLTIDSHQEPHFILTAAFLTAALFVTAA